MRKIILLAVLVLSTITAAAQSSMQTPNMKHAMAALKEGDRENGLQYLSNEVDQNPTNGFAYAFIATILKQEGGFEGAMLKYANNAIRFLPKSESDLILEMASACADLYEEGRDSIKALEYYDIALAADKKNPNVRLHRANYFDSHGQFDRMLEEAQECVKLRADEPIGYYYLANAYTKLKDYANAEKAADQGLEKIGATLINSLLDASKNAKKSGETNVNVNVNDNKPLRAALTGLRAGALCAQNKYEESLKAVTNSLRAAVHSEGVEAVYALADSTDALALVDSLKKLAEEQPGKFAFPAIISDVYEHKNDYVSAIYYALLANKIEEKASVWRGIANNLEHHLGMIEKAEEMYFKAIEKDSTDAATYILLGDLYHDLGRYDEALTYLNKAISMGEGAKNSSVYYLRGRVYRDMHDYDRCVSDYLRMLEAEPDDAGNAFSVGTAYKMMGDTTMAEKMFRIGMQMLAGKEPSAEHYVAMGEMDKAVEKAKTMVTTDRSASQHYNAACVYAQAGRAEEALTSLERAFERGFRNFYHIAWDDDLNNIRELPEFIELVNRFKSINLDEQARFNELLLSL